MTYNVDVSQVGCQCTAGLYLVSLNDETCSWDPKDEGVTPQCATIDIMENNIWDYASQSNPCEFGSCDVDSQSRVTAMEISEFAYGPGSAYDIDTNRGFEVEAKFFSDPDMTELQYIQVTLRQDERSVTLTQDSTDYLAPLTSQLYYNMAVGISVYENDNEFCEAAGTGCDQSMLVVSEIRWTSGDSIVEVAPEPELIIGGPAERLDMCEDGCTQCNDSWMSDDETFIFQTCTDWTVYRYGGKCGKRLDQSLCNTGSDQYCHKSYPHGDPDKYSSIDAACRTVPPSYIEGEFNYATKECRKATAGLCRYGCNGTCHNSWFIDDEEKWKGASAMCRCKEI